ncbi:MAG: phosphoribosyl-AMP cyclohydrolase [Myxococcota bacterium]
MKLEIESLWSKTRPDPMGLLPCVVQDVRTRRVLMVAWVNRPALEHTLETGNATFWSRSRRELWEKGATSGNTQRLVHVRLDCDGDTLLYLVEPSGPACHEGYSSCFSWRRVGNGWSRDPEPNETPPEEQPFQAEVVGDLIDAVTARESSAIRAARPEKAIRVGADVEQKARVLANALQLKQRERIPVIATELITEIARQLQNAGVPLSEIARSVRTARQEPSASAVPTHGGPLTPSEPPAARAPASSVWTPAPVPAPSPGVAPAAPGGTTPPPDDDDWQ